MRIKIIHVENIQLKLWVEIRIRYDTIYIVDKWNEQVSYNSICLQFKWNETLKISLAILYRIIEYMLVRK